MKIVIDIPERDYDLACKYPNALIATYAHYIKDGKPYEERPHGDLIRVKDLTAFIRACRDELFDKMKDYSQGEFEIRDNMLINFEQIVKLASSKYKADMRE